MPRPTPPRRSPLALLLGAALASVFGAGAAHAETSETVVLRPLMFANGEAVELTRPWLFHPGDDPRWAAPGLDESGWEARRPRLEGEDPRRAGEPGAGWFRRHLRVEKGPMTLVLLFQSRQASEVYLDGALLLAVTGEGPPATSREPAGNVSSRTVTFSPGTDHLLAVRLRAGERDTSPGFLLSLGALDAAALRRESERQRLTVLAVFTALPAFLALLHFVLFWSYPKARENLFYACSMLSFAAVAVCDLGLGEDASPFWRDLTDRLSNPFVVVTIFFVLLTYYAVRTQPLSRAWRFFALTGAVLVAAFLVRPGDWQEAWKYLFLALTAAEVLRTEIWGRKVEREGVKVLLYGLLVLNAAAALQFLIDAEVVQPIPGLGAVYVVGTLAFAISMSIFLARGFARTSIHLERRLDEVHTLSDQVLSQERAAHEAELRRQRLEAETARQSAEIEAARALQVSMLPKELPQVAGLEVAAAMATASEVGGDYYDFRSAGDGSLLVAFGDATGHGVAAGIMVTAIKALFSSLEGDEELPEILAGCDRVLRRMNVKPFHMCLSLARITPRSVTLCLAAMPPVLVYRAATGTVEELGAGGLPVGSKLPGRWQETTATLALGDTLLFASDGFPELLDPQDRELGFEAAREAFRAAAGEPVSTLIERLLERAAAWRGEREQEDDMTFVVVRATGA